MLTDASGGFVCSPPQTWTVPTYPAACDNTVYVAVFGAAGSGVLEQHGLGISANGIALTRLSHDSSGREVAVFSAYADGRIF